MDSYTPTASAIAPFVSHDVALVFVAYLSNYDRANADHWHHNL